MRGTEGLIAGEMVFLGFVDLRVLFFICISKKNFISWCEACFAQASSLGQTFGQTTKTTKNVSMVSFSMCLVFVKILSLIVDHCLDREPVCQESLSGGLVIVNIHPTPL